MPIALGLTIALGIGIFSSVHESTGNIIGLLMPVAIVFALLLLRALFHVQSIRKLFASGVEEIGVVSNIVYYKGVSIEYKYKFENVEFSNSESFNFWGRLKSLEVNGHMILLVDPKNPKRSAIRNAYVDKMAFDNDFAVFSQLAKSKVARANAVSADDNRSYIDKLRGHVR